MATTEAASAPTGPRYAPDDPSLPPPWKALIDGSTVYYWNPETNITQYEKPTTLPPQLASGPPVPSTPTLAPLPGARMMPPNGVPSQHAHQMPPVGQQHPQAQQPGQLTPQQMIHQSTQQMYPQHQMPQQGNQIPQQARQQTQMYQSAQIGQPPGYQFAHQQMQHMPYHQHMGQQSSQQQTPHTQLQQYSHPREFNEGFSHREEADLQQGKQIGLSPSQVPQAGIPSIQNPPTGANSIQFGGSSVNMQHPSGMDLGHQQHGPRFNNQAGQMRGHQPHVPPVGLKMGYEENKPGSDYHFNANKDGPKLAPIPMARNQQEMRMGGLPHQNASPGLSGGLNPVPGPALNGIYSNSSGGPPFPNIAMTRPPLMASGPADAINNLSAVEVYYKKHEITATGDNVPAPFMSFEDTGFPPEILREVRYLLQRRSICRTYATANS